MTLMIEARNGRLIFLEAFAGHGELPLPERNDALARLP